MVIRQPVDLLSYVQTLIPPGVQVSLVDDCEFGRPLLLEYLDWWGWDYALRQLCNHLGMLKGDPSWRRIDSFDLQPGMTVWLGIRIKKHSQCSWVRTIEPALAVLLSRLLNRG